MEEINPNNIKAAEIVVGVPSYNEADTITNVVKKLDQGLEKYFPDRKAVIINADNNSSDNTREVFLSVKTKTPKIYVSTPPGISGKGNNLRNIFLKVKDLGALYAVIVDSDIKNMTPEWIKCLLGPLVKSYDYVSPIYYRDEDDGSITNHICFPLVYGLLGYNIRQPIAGEIGFSGRLAEYWLKQKWSAETKKFGVDIFMLLNAIQGGFKLCRVNLGSKIHKPSAPKLGFMFSEVAGTLFRLLSENPNLWQKKISFHGLPLVCKAKTTKYPDFELDYKPFAEKAAAEFLANEKSIQKCITPELWQKIKKIAVDKSLNIDSSLWPQIVYEMFYQYHTGSNKKSIIKFLGIFYLGRMSLFIKEAPNKNPVKAEQIIQRQAQKFYRKRNYLLSLYDH